MKFKSGTEMLNTINLSDLYSPELEIYVFLYNEAGGIAYYFINHEEAKELERKSRNTGEYWSAFLGIGGRICEDPYDEENPPNCGCSNIDFCNQYYQYQWIFTNEVVCREEEIEY